MKISHPFIIDLSFSFMNTAKLYLGMPFIEGGDLYNLKRSKKRFKEDTVKLYIMQISLALSYLHSEGIIHRDLKSENIMVCRDGYLKLIDFGVSQIVEKDERTKTMCGTVEYMAPEMLQEQEYNAAIDWWALGVLTYELLFGFTPYMQTDISKQLEKIQKQELKFNTEKLNIQLSDEA